MSFSSLLNKSATILNKTMTQQSNGEVVEVWTTASTAKTRYEENSKPVMIDGQYVTNIDSYLFFFPLGTIIERDNRIECEGKTFHVDGIFINEGLESNHHLEVYAKYIDND